jgi:hypothetical protein
LVGFFVRCDGRPFRCAKDMLRMIRRRGIRVDFVVLN